MRRHKRRQGTRGRAGGRGGGDGQRRPTEFKGEQDDDAGDGDVDYGESEKTRAREDDSKGGCGRCFFYFCR